MDGPVISVDNNLYVIKMDGGSEISIVEDKLAYFVPFDIEKIDKKERMVYGWASTECMDGQGEVVELAAIEEALPDYKKWSNIREMHQPSAVGIAPEVEIKEKGLWVGAKIIDDSAWKKVEEGVYKGFSIGGKALQKVAKFIEKLKLSVPHITKLKLIEISLVDRPANPECVFQLVKYLERDNTSTTSEKEEGGITLKGVFAQLHKLLGGAQKYTAEVAKVTGSDDSANELICNLSKKEETEQIAFVKSLIDAVGIDASVLTKTGDQSKTEVEEKREEKDSEEQKSEKPDLEKMFSESSIAKKVDSQLTELRADFAKLCGEEGILKIGKSIDDLTKANEESVAKVEGLSKSLEELTTRLTSLEDTRGIRRSGGGEGDVDVNKVDGWASVFVGM
jgi:hypothetical protein